MKRIIIHWTAGQYNPNATDLADYHFLVDNLGKVYQYPTMKHKPEDNLNCKDDNYAHHTGGGNTDSIGVSMCGMMNFKDKNHVGNFPLTAIQFEATMQLCAKLARKYNIEITPDTAMTHYEFGQKHPDTPSFGKIDIVFIPAYPWLSKDDIGNFIRSKIRWYQKYMEENKKCQD